ncbi:MAG: hypothetical protein SGPRY_013372 [Prymnesium sp.]
MKAPFSLPEVKCLFGQLLQAVSHMHANYVMHRDLKLSNLLLAADGTLKEEEGDNDHDHDHNHDGDGWA